MLNRLYDHNKLKCIKFRLFVYFDYSDYAWLPKHPPRYGLQHEAYYYYEKSKDKWALVTVTPRYLLLR